jgi:acyl-CoA reductase-like NAD-dependent aldehyde dehydrogenase
LISVFGQSVSDVADAYAAAVAAQRVWEATAPRERAAVLRRAADILLARKDEIIDLTIREVGGVRKFAEIIWYFAWSIIDASADYPGQARGGCRPMCPTRKAGSIGAPSGSSRSSAPGTHPSI